MLPLQPLLVLKLEINFKNGTMCSSFLRQPATWLNTAFVTLDPDCCLSFQLIELGSWLINSNQSWV